MSELHRDGGDSEMSRVDQDDVSIPAKRCRYCGGWSNSKSPWPLMGTPLANWDPYLPWGRGKAGRAVGDRCKPCMIVWEQGVFAPDFQYNEDVFQKKIAENPSVLHEFLAVRQKLVKMKQDNPHLRFKLESRGFTREKVVTSMVGESGLEQPDEYFVELSAYEQQYGEADPKDIVFDEVEPGSGHFVAGVNVRTGTPGWYKRINRNYNSVSRSCRLTDAVEIDPSRNCVDRMQAAARAAVLTRKAPIAKELPLMFANRPMISDTAAPSTASTEVQSTRAGAGDEGETASAAGDGREPTSDDEPESYGGLQSMLKTYGSGGKNTNPKAKARGSSKPSTTTSMPPPAQPQVPGRSIKRPTPSLPASAERPPKAAKIEIGKAKSKAKVKAKAKAMAGSTSCELSILGPEATTSPANLGMLCDADSAVIDAYGEQLKVLKSIVPPLPDAPFKAYLTDVNAKLNSLSMDMKKKQRSCLRRTLGANDPLYAGLEQLLQTGGALQQLVKCLIGTGSMDNSKTLLEVIDSSAIEHGFSFNGSVFRRALKALINQDFAHSDWQSLVTKTVLVINERFVSEGDGMTADGYYITLCAQILQKLLRTASQKFKPKESTFSPLNKQALDATIGFIGALAVATSSPETLAIDAGHINRLMHAENSPIEEVLNSMNLLDKLRKSNEQSEKLPLSHALAATPIGTRIITDVKATLELRKETTGDMETKLNDILSGKLTMDNLDSMLTSLVEIYDEWTKIQQNKKLMKEAIQSKQSLITEASTWMVCQYWTLYVNGWAAESLTSLDSRGVFSAPEVGEWIAYDKIAIVDAFKSAKTVLDLFAQLADSVMKLKVKTPGEIQRVHRLLEQLQPSVVSFQAQIVNKTPEDKTFGVNAFNQCCEQISLMIKKVNSCKVTAIEVEAKSDTSGLYNSVACVQGLDVTMPDNLSKRCEQLKLYAACLEDTKKRDIFVRLADFTLVLVKSGTMMKNLTDIKNVELAGLSEKLGEYTNDEILAFGQVLINEKPAASPSFDAQTLLIFVQKIGTDMMKYLNGWHTSVVGILKELCATATAMNLTEPSVIDFGDVGDGLCRKISDYPELQSINESELLSISDALSGRLKETKAMTNASSEKLEELNQVVTTAKSHYNIIMTLLCVIAIVKIMSCKRFVRAVKDGNQPPVNLTNQLGASMKIAHDQNLQIPGSLQAKVLKFTSSESNSANKA